jgi:PAS domain-containing protein
MATKTIPFYQIDGHWKIVKANEAFCQTFQCTESGLIGRDVRELLRADWKADFRTYVAQAMVGVGDAEVTIPLVAPCGKEAWFKHQLEPLMADGLLACYRATIQPHLALAAAAPKRWWEFRAVAPRQVWDFDTELMTKAA